jgi:ABC-2 type transport system permease protein
MRKVFVIAAREYNAAVRTKAFLISLLMMPLLMGGSIAVQTLLRDQPSTGAKRFAVIDRTPGQSLFPILEAKIKDPSKGHSLESPDANGKDNGKEFRSNAGRASWQVELAVPQDSSAEALERLRGELQEKVRRRDLLGFVEIGPQVFELLPEGSQQRADGAHAVNYWTKWPTERDFGSFAQQTVTDGVRQRRARELGVSAEKARALSDEVSLTRDGPVNELTTFLAPLGLMMLMFMVVLMTTTPLMQGVLEEKMQRIAEVLLGSVGPFQLMLGKLVGMTAVSLTMSAVYLSGGWWLAEHSNVHGLFSAGLLAWFFVFQALAALMYGSLFAAVGAACTDMKETQTLMWPVMLLVCMPMFIVGQVLQDPNGMMVQGVSYFPFAAPMLMMARMGVQSGVPWWQPVVGVVGVLATTIVCVWAAGRIFRVGILMQGKGARMSEIVRWVLHG